MIGYNPLKRRPFSTKLVSNKVTAFCFIALAGSAASTAGPAVRTTVATDDRTGRLVRTVTVEARAIEPRAVESRVVESRAVPIASRTPSSKPPVSREAVRSIIAETAKRHEVDPLLVESMVQVESGYDPKAVSHKGALGLMQLIPATAKRFGVANPFDAQQNIEGGVRYLKYLRELYKNDDRLALAAYNAGEGAVNKYGWIPPYRETQRYVYEVGRRYGAARRMQAPAASQAAPLPKIESFTDAEGRIHFRMP